MTRAMRLLLLGCILFWAQCALAEHGIEHAFHDHEEACLECLVLPGFAAVPTQLAHHLPPCSGLRDAPVAVPPAPTFSSPLSFRSRAPPLLQNR